MDIEQIRSMNDAQLVEQLAQSGERMFRVRFQKSMGNLEGVKTLREQRRTVAQVKTIQRERARANQTGSAQ